MRFEIYVLDAVEIYISFVCGRNWCVSRIGFSMLINETLFWGNYERSERVDIDKLSKYLFSKFLFVWVTKLTFILANCVFLSVQQVQNSSAGCNIRTKFEFCRGTCWHTINQRKWCYLTVTFYLPFSECSSGCIETWICRRCVWLPFVRNSSWKYVRLKRWINALTGPIPPNPY